LVPEEWSNPVKVTIPIVDDQVESRDPFVILFEHLDRIEAKLDRLFDLALDEEHSKARLREAFARYLEAPE
jgi:hypothetical protein